MSGTPGGHPLKGKSQDKNPLFDSIKIRGLVSTFDIKLLSLIHMRKACGVRRFLTLCRLLKNSDVYYFYPTCSLV